MPEHIYIQILAENGPTSKNSLKRNARCLNWTNRHKDINNEVVVKTGPTCHNSQVNDWRTIDFIYKVEEKNLRGGNLKTNQ